jgi:dTDP-4-amino-4,6-dideoxygalactose transaminase
MNNFLNGGTFGRREFLAASGAALAAAANTRAGNAPEAGNKLAIDGGTPVITKSSVLPIRWGDPERARLDAMLRQRSLLYWKGPQTTALVDRVQKLTGLKHVMTCSSGTAALHIAVAASEIGPGDEVITTPITDIGTVIGVIYQLGVPVFADLGSSTYNLDPSAVEELVTPKTKAIIAVHLTGNPCDMDSLKTIADKHGLILIEDCAQAWGASYQGRPIGTIGHIACWSLQDSKHITCGDGGVVASNDERFGPLLQRFGDKGTNRLHPAPFEVFATNYRMSEPQAAIAAAQLDRLEAIASDRFKLGTVFNKRISRIPGVLAHQVDPRDRCVYWFTMFRFDPRAFTCDRTRFVKALVAEGVPASAGYIPVPLYKNPVFLKHGFFAGRWPVREMGLTDMNYNKVSCPEAEAILADGIRVTIHEAMTEDYIENMSLAVSKVASHFLA